MYENRKKLYEKIEAERKSKLLVYVTGDRPGLETQIHTEVIEYFASHLDSMVDGQQFPDKISLYLYSRGGNTLAGWTIVNLLRQFCKELEVIVFFKAQSTATLICLGADNIVMTKQATLGPIDPSINSPLNPQLPGAPVQARIPISVESVAGYIELAKKEFGIKAGSDLTQVYLKLSEHVHPIALGNVFRARGQIQMLAKKLLNKHNKPISDDQCQKIINVLCSESGSHDYTISQREARELGLKIETPTMDFYNLLKEVHNDIVSELQFGKVYDPLKELAGNTEINYTFKRAMVESVSGGSDKFISEGTLKRIQTNQGEGVYDERTFEGWRKDT